MNRQYYSIRKNKKGLTVKELYQKLLSLYIIFRDKDYFKNEAGITETGIPESTQHEAMLVLDFQPFPIEEWPETKITEDNILDTIEYLYDHVSKPGELVGMTTDSGYNYYDYESYDKDTGMEEYRSKINLFLWRYRKGYELSKEGKILSLGEGGLQNILQAEIPFFGDKNIDKKVQDAIIKWRNRRLSLQDRREAIRDLTDVFEWLKKTAQLKKALSRKDESALFEIANNFSIRHHNPKQLKDYDESIWFSWMFHFYLATFHAVARMIQKGKNQGQPANSADPKSRSAD